MRIIAIINDKKDDTEVLLKSLKGNTGDNIRVYSFEDRFSLETRIITMDNVIPLKLKKRYGKIVPKSFSAMPILRDLIDEGFDEILMLRGNIIIRKSISGIWDRIKYNTLTARILKGVKNEKALRFQIGVIALGNSPYTYRFINNVIARIERGPYYRREPFIFFDEIKKVPEMKFFRLNPVYNDITFFESSAIWHHKGEHYAEVLFEKEYKRLLTDEGKRVVGLEL